MNKDIRYCNFPGHTLIKTIEIQIGSFSQKHFSCKNCHDLSLESTWSRTMDDLCFNCYCDKLNIDKNKGK